MAVTLEDVARHSQVSVMTVSRVINGKGYVADETKERVQKAISDLDYRPNLIARGLVTQKTDTIGVLASQLENPIYSLILSGVNRYAAHSGLNVILGSGLDAQGLLHSANNLLDKQIDGLIVFPAELYTDEKEHTIDPQGLETFYTKLDSLSLECRKKGIPVVVVGDFEAKHACSRVCADYKGGAKMAVKYLYQKGHRKIGQIRYVNLNNGVWGERCSGFYEGMREVGCIVNEGYFETALETADSAYEAGMRLFSREDIPTALYCANDVMAIGVMHAAQKMGLRVPQDVSIIGHDGSTLIDLTFPKLTTVSIQPYEIGLNSMKQIVQFIHNESCTDIQIQPRLIEGDTVASI